MVAAMGCFVVDLEPTTVVVVVATVLVVVEVAAILVDEELLEPIGWVVVGELLGGPMGCFLGVLE